MSEASKRNTSEQLLHFAVAEYLGYALKPPVFWTTFPAGGGGKMRGAILKGMGLKAGVPDILVFANCEMAAACKVIGIELKAGTGKLSEDQIVTHADMMLAGARCRVARSIGQVQDILIANGIPIHARAA